MSCAVRFVPSHGAPRREAVRTGTTLLAAVRAAGLPLASACDARGLCGRCGLEVLGGAGALSAPDAREAEVLRRNRQTPGLRLACRARVAGNVVVRAPYW